MSRVPTLTTTTYGVLGLLAVRPYSTYELAKAMGLSVGRVWPRAQSKLFEEPKKLVQHGFATAKEELVGRRPRTVYTITRAGRRALAAWLAEPGDGPVLEFEALVKLIFAEEQVPVEVHLRGGFRPIDGRFHWIGRIRTPLEISSGTGVVLSTDHGSATGKLSDVDPWGHFRISGVGRPPF